MAGRSFDPPAFDHSDLRFSLLLDDSHFAKKPAGYPLAGSKAVLYADPGKLSASGDKVRRRVESPEFTDRSSNLDFAGPTIGHTGRLRDRPV